MPDENSTPWSGFRHVDLGHVLTMVTMVVGLFISFLAYDRRMGQSEANEKSLTFSINQLADRVDKMDSTGTQASQRGILKDSEMTSSNTRRIDSLENNLNKLSPQVERMDTNLEWVTKWIQRQDDGKGVR
jgi:hypothetical protein